MDWRMGGRFAGGRHAPALDVTLRLAGPSPLWAIPFHAAASLCKYAARMLPATTLGSPECHCSPSQGAGGYFPSAAFCSNLLHGPLSITFSPSLATAGGPSTGVRFTTPLNLPQWKKRSLYVKKTPHHHSQLPAAISSPYGAQKAMLWPAAILREADAPPDLACLDTG